jgi:hypothetical protein
MSGRSDIYIFIDLNTNLKKPSWKNTGSFYIIKTSPAALDTSFVRSRIQKHAREHKRKPAEMIISIKWEGDLPDSASCMKGAATAASTVQRAYPSAPISILTIDGGETAFDNFLDVVPILPTTISEISVGFCDPPPRGLPASLWEKMTDLRKIYVFKNNETSRTFFRTLE